MHRSTFLPLQHAATLIFSVDSGLEKRGADAGVIFGGGSQPEFACGGLGEQLALLASIDMPIDTPEETAAGEAAANLCIETMGPVGGLLHTEYVANDMDEIRKALGAEQISYYGGSYGSTVGVWYATLFPDSVRAMVVDGADNPVDQAANQQERVAEELEELEAMEALLEKALTACADPECPIYNDGDPVGYYLRAAQKLGLVNAAADNHPEAGVFGVVSNLYSEEQWPDLWQGLFELNENDDPALLLESAKIQWLGGEFGEARLADHVNCLDAWVLHPEVDRASQLDDSVVTEALVEEQLPLITAANPFSVGACPFYDQFAPEPLEEPLDGSGVPILVVGNHDDPATPFAQSEELVTEVLSNGYLLETSHYKHVVYPKNQCVNGHVHRALIDLELPSARRVFCEEDRTFAPATPAAPEPDPTAGERIDWSPCGAFECGSIQVPADYRDPEAGSINIALNMHRATSPDQRIGYLLVNPGGPGGSGLEMVALAKSPQMELRPFADELVEHFDIVGFDPRGVELSFISEIFFEHVKGVDLRVLVGGGSWPEFACGGPGEQHDLLASIDLPIDTPEEIAAGEAAANLCIESMGRVGGLLHTEYVARDMDEIRKALGAEQISYYGASYGSAVGAWYATLFPESVRAMVVDGADNPVDQAANQQERVAEEVEEYVPLADALDRALAACADPQCPIYNDGDPVGYYKQAVAKLELVNTAIDNPQGGLFGVITTVLYDESTWPDLWQGLYDLSENDDPSILAGYAMIQLLGSDPRGASFTSHVNCLDKWVLDPELDRATQLDDRPIFDAAIKDMFPLLAVMEGAFFPEACPYYDQFAPSPLEIPFDGGGVPILVVGNRSDRATSFGESEEFAVEVLSNGYLLETDHPTHIVYPANQCVNEHVHRALIDGVYPSARRVFCEEDRTFAPAAAPN